MARRRFWILPFLAGAIASAVDASFGNAGWVAGIGWPAMLISAAAMSVAQFEALGGGSVSLSESAADAFSRAAPLALLLAMHGVLAAAGQRWAVMELVNWFLLSWLSLAIPVCVLERLSVREALRRCAALTDGRLAHSLLVLYFPVHWAQRSFARSERDWMSGLLGLGLYSLAAAICAASLAAFYLAISQPPAAARQESAQP